MIHRYERCEPQVFRLGDIVEAQVSFVVIPVRGGRRKMLTVLRSLALIKGNFKKVSTKLTGPGIQLTQNEADWNPVRRRRVSKGKSDVNQVKSRIWASTGEGS